MKRRSFLKGLLALPALAAGIKAADVKPIVDQVDEQQLRLQQLEKELNPPLVVKRAPGFQMHTYIGNGVPDRVLFKRLDSGEWEVVGS